MTERDQRTRRRCLTTGCNPVMHGDTAAAEHTAATGHRTAAWPIRSAAGKRKAAHRNRTGYYDRYNVGAKDRTVRAAEGRMAPLADRHSGGDYLSQDGDGWTHS